MAGLIPELLPVRRSSPGSSSTTFPALFNDGHLELNSASRLSSPHGASRLGSQYLSNFNEWSRGIGKAYDPACLTGVGTTCHICQVTRTSLFARSYEA